MAVYTLDVRGSENVKVYVNDVLVTNGSSYNFKDKDTMTFKADEGFYFDRAIEFEDEMMSTVRYDLTNSGYNSDHTECKIPYNWFEYEYVDLSSSIYISTDVLEVEEPPVEEFDYTLNITGSENVTVYVNDVLVPNGSGYNFNTTTDVMTFKADEGFYLDSPITFENEMLNNVYYILSNDGYNVDYTECKIPATWISNQYVDLNQSIQVSTKVKEDEEEPPIEDIENDYISVYTLSQEQLNILSKTLYEIRQGDSIGFLDIGYFMNNLYVLPFNIDGIISDVLTKIKLGGIVLDVFSREINNSKVTVDLGNIPVPLKYNNVYDFINTECNIYLPYAKKITLDTSYVIGQELRVEYIINLYTQETTINIYSSITNKIVYSDSIEVGYKIPFVQQVNFDLVHKFDYNLQNKIDTPYVEVVRKKPYPNKYHNESRFTQLNNELGYLRVDEINLETTATLQEQEEIKMLLKQGIYIK